MGDRRRPLLALAWIATAVASGLLFALLLRREPERIVVVGDPPAPETEDAAARPGARPPRPADGSAAPIPDSPPAGAGRLPSAPILGTASLEVRVLAPDGTPHQESGVVYAVGPGEPGSDDADDLCQVPTSEPGAPVLLRLPLPGRYDVGFSSEGSRTLALDVEVPAGPPGRLDLTVPGGHPLRALGPAPGSLGGTGPSILLFLYEIAGREKVRFPGRGQAGRTALWFRLGPDGTAESPPLPAGREYRVQPEFHEGIPGLGGIGEGQSSSSPRYGLRAEPDVARGGQSVRIVAEAAALLRVHLLMEAPAGGPPAVKGSGLPLFVGFRQGTVERAWRTQLNFLDSGPPRMTVQFTGGDGPCEFRWSGNGIQGGSIQDAILRKGEILERTLFLVPDPAGVEEARPEPKAAPERAPPVPLAVTGLPGGADRPFGVWIRLPSEDGNEEGDWAWDGDEVPTEMEGIVRRAPRIWAVSGTDFASDGTAVPASGTLSIAMRPAGLLLSAPDEPIPEGVGRLLVRLPDRRPIFSGESNPRPDQEAGAGDLLGPFPEGTYTFEVRLGGVRLPDASATVRAGRIEVLRLRTR